MVTETAASTTTTPQPTSPRYKRIGLITSGGDAPGMNACIRAVVRSARFYGLEVYGFVRGYNGLIGGDYQVMDAGSVANIIQRGGTILKTARSEEFRTKEGRQKAADNLKRLGIEALVAIGGNGTFTGAEIFLAEHGIPTIGLPGTIDNDLYGSDYTIGFDTAINTALDAIDRLRDTADSHDRLFFVEVMGRDAGYIGIDVGIAGGAEAVLIPEQDISIDELALSIEQSWSRGKTSSIIIVSEGEVEGGAEEIAKQVTAKLSRKENYRVTVLGHLQRGGTPSAKDRILASRLGLAAVEALNEGRINVMVGVINDELAYTPFADAINKKKVINESLLRVAYVLGR